MTIIQTLLGKLSTTQKQMNSINSYLGKIDENVTNNIHSGDEIYDSIHKIIQYMREEINSHLT